MSCQSHADLHVYLHGAEHIVMVSNRIYEMNEKSLEIFSIFVHMLFGLARQTFLLKDDGGAVEFVEKM